MLVTAAKLIFEAYLPHLLGTDDAAETVGLADDRPLARPTQARFACGVLGGLLMPGLLLRIVTEASPSSPAVIAASALLFVACLAGELLNATCSSLRLRRHACPVRLRS